MFSKLELKNKVASNVSDAGLRGATLYQKRDSREHVSRTVGVREIPFMFVTT
jgi:hypothetical protein